ncbi:hypothetical protein R0J87_15475 [Halomonas sp. SIMBA_159]
MKDLIKIAKTVIASANPKKEALDSNAKQLAEKFSTLKVESKNPEIKQLKETIFNAATLRLDNYNFKKEKQEIEYTDLTVEVTHAKYNASLLELDTKTMQYTLKRSIDLASAVNQSREYKKRLKSMLTACAHRDASKLDKALLALQQALKAKEYSELSVEQIQKIMEHSTATQANYFKKFAHELGVVTASRSNAIPMIINKDNDVYKDFVSL